MVEWSFNGDIVDGDSEDAIQVSFWATNDYIWVGCATVMCQGAVIETCWEWPNPGDELECENVVVAVNVEWGSAAGVDPLELELVLSMMDVELDLDLSQILEGGSFNETLAFCLPVGFCYELEAAIGNLNALDVDLFEIAAGVGQELPAWQDVLSALTSPDASWSVALGVDVLEGCDDESGIAQGPSLPSISAFPNPATDVVRFTGWEGEPVRVVLRNALGQTLADLPNVWPGDAVELPQAWRGVVLAELTGNGWTARPVLVVN
jgi:hypothetical protein